MRIELLLLLWGVLFHTLNAQEIPEPWLEKIHELSSDENESDRFITELLSLLETPIPVNSCEPEELMRVPGMTWSLAVRMVAHREETGPYQSLLELQVLEGVERETFPLLKHVLTVGLIAETKTSGNQAGKGEYLVLLQPCLQKREGFRNGNYSGPAFRQLHKWQYRPGPSWRMGVTAESDAGERIRWNKRQAGFDFVSAFVEYSGKSFGAIAGDYRVNVGQGLVLGNGSGFGSSAFVGRVFKAGKVQVNRSAEENLLMRGACISIRTPNTRQQVFVFYKRVDGKGDGDTALFREGGLHRTETELARRRKVYRKGIGYSLGMERTLFSWSFQTLYLNQQHREGLYAGLSHTFKQFGVFLFGEVGWGKGEGLRLIESLVWTPSAKLDFSMLFRHYPQTNGNPFSGGFSAFGTPENESGIYFSMQYDADKSRRWKLFLDHGFRSNPSYRVSRAYWYRECFLEHEQRVAGINLSGRLTTRSGERDVTLPEEKSVQTLPWIKTQIRIEAEKTVDDWKVRSRVENSRFRQRGLFAKGFLFYLDLQWRPPMKPHYIAFRYQVFQAPDYDSRIYAYESDVLYAYSVPSFSGTGQRCYVLFRMRIRRGMDIWLKQGITWYSDKETIASGNDRLNTSYLLDSRMELRFTF